MAGEVIVMQSAGMGLGNGHHAMSTMKLGGGRGTDSPESADQSSGGGSSRFGDHEDVVISGDAPHLEGGRSSSSSASSIMEISPGSLFAFHPEQPNFFSTQKSRGDSEDPSSHHVNRPLSVDSAIPNIFSFAQMDSELSHIDGVRGGENHDHHHHHHQQQHRHQQDGGYGDYRGQAGRGTQPIGKAPRGLFSSTSFDSSSCPSSSQMGGGPQQGPRGSNSGRPLNRTFGSFPSAAEQGGGGDLLHHGSGMDARALAVQFHSADGVLPHTIPTAGGARPPMNGLKTNGHHAASSFMYNGSPGGHHPVSTTAPIYGSSSSSSSVTAGENGSQQQQERRAAYLPSAVDDNTLYNGMVANGGVPANATMAAAAAAQRVYFQGYDASGGAMLAVSAHPQGGGLVAPTHFVTAAGMVPINQLMPFHMVRTLAAASPMGSTAAGVPLDGGAAMAAAYAAAGPGIPFFVQAQPNPTPPPPHHHSLSAARLYGGERGAMEARDGGKDDDWHYGGRGGRRHDLMGKGAGDMMMMMGMRGDKRGNGGGAAAKKRVDRDSDVLAALNSDSPSLEEILKSSSVHSLSQDQVGCRFLQLKLDESGGEAATTILAQAKPYLGDMMTDPFGNYLFQKILEKVSEPERTHILSCVRDQLVDAALNLHGTRSVQRLVELCKTDEQLDMIKQALRRDVVRLCVDANGNHVIQRALQHLGAEDRGFIFDAVSAACLEVSTHRHGCCVMQRCLDAATPEQKRVLVSEVGSSCFQLMQDPYGNYVVQYVLDRCHGDEIRPVTSCPIGRIASLSVQKYSSNVIEKCLEKATEDIQSAYIEEMCIPGNIKHLMQDQYANYVVQRALSVASHGHGMQLVEAIRPHLHAMRNTAGGRRIVAKIVKRFPSVDLGNDFVNPR